MTDKITRADLFRNYNIIKNQIQAFFINHIVLHLFFFCFSEIGRPTSPSTFFLSNNLQLQPWWLLKLNICELKLHACMFALRGVKWAWLDINSPHKLWPCLPRTFTPSPPPTQKILFHTCKNLFSWENCVPSSCSPCMGKVRHPWQMWKSLI